MSHDQYSVLKLNNPKKQLAPLLRPFLTKDYFDGIYYSECLDFKKIYPLPPKPPEITEREWSYQHWESRPYLYNGHFVGNEHFFYSVNGIPGPIYQRLSAAIGEKFTVEVESVDDGFNAMWEFRPDGLLRCVYFKEFSICSNNPIRHGAIPKRFRNDFRSQPSDGVDSEGNQFGTPISDAENKSIEPDAIEETLTSKRQ